MRSSWMVALGALGALGACGGDKLVLPQEGEAAEIVVVSGNGNSGPVGQPLTAPLVVRIEDSQNRPVADQRVVFSLGAGATGGDLDPDSVTTGADGLASTRWSLGPTAGQQKVDVKLVGGGPAAEQLRASFTATAGAGGASTLELVSGNEQTGTAGSALADSLVVRALDENGNPVAGVEIAWTATGGTVSAERDTTETDGRSAVRRVLGTTAGAQATTASVVGVTDAVVSFTSTAAVGSVGKLAVVTQPSSTAESGTPLGTQPRVQLQDAGGNNVREGGIAVSVQLASGPEGGALQGQTTVPTSSAGLATFTNLAISGPAGEYTLNFTGVDITGTTSGAITIAAGSPTKLAFLVQPANAGAGATIAPPVQVVVQDAQGNTVTDATNAVSLAIANNAGSGTLGGTTTAAAVNGVATFADLSIDRAGNGYTLRATASGLTAVTSTGFNIGTGTATKLGMAVQPSASVASGQVFPVQPSVQVQDASGNSVAAPGIVVTAAIKTGGGTLNGTPTATTDVGGLAVFSGLSISGSAGARTLEFTATGLAAVTSSSITVGSGGAGAIVEQAGNGQSAPVGTAVPVDPSVKVTDASGNPVGGVQVTFAVTGGGGSVSGATPTTNSSGIATVGSWTLGPSAGANTLTATAAGSGITGNPVTFTATGVVVGANKLAMATQPSSSVQNGQVFPQQPVVQLTDATGAPLSQGGVNVTASINTGAGTLGGDLQVATGSDGRAVFTDLRITGAVGDRTLLFAASGVTSVSSATIAVTAGPVSGSDSEVSANPTSISAIGGSSTITVTVRDASDNPIAGTTVVPAASGSDNAFSPTSASTDANGVATFTFSSGTPESKTITATANGVAIGDNATVTVTAVGTTIEITNDLTAPTTVGTPITMTVQVTATAGSPGGTVTITGGGDSCDAALNGSGAGTCDLVPTETGTDLPFTATYPANGPFSGDSDTETHTVSTVPTTTSLSSPGSLYYGQTATFTATVSASSTPTGSVQFRINGAPSGSPAPLSAGTAELVRSDLAAGDYAVSAEYQPTGPFAASSDDLDGGQEILPVTTSTAITGSAPESTVGVAFTVSFAVNVTSAGSTALAGDVTVTDDIESCTVPVAAGSCELTLNTPGSRPLTAMFAGNGNFAPSESAPEPHLVSTP